MAVSEKFHEAVRDGKIRSVRIMMKDSLLADLSFSDFKTMESMAAPSMNGLYDAHDERSLEICDFISNFTHYFTAYYPPVTSYLILVIA